MGEALTKIYDEGNEPIGQKVKLIYTNFGIELKNLQTSLNGIVNN